ncbi:hypothetical protein SDJN02_19286, partial [Cucurbita argyrosperma subsp. argyrosperma]
AFSHLWLLTLTPQSDLLRDSISICDFNRTIHPQPRSVFLCDPITFARPLGSYFRSQVRSPVALQFPSTLSRGSYNWNQGTRLHPM